MRKTLLSLSLFIALPLSLMGDTIKGNFAFKKRPPKLGLVYMSEDSSLKEAPVVDQKGKEFVQPLYVGPNGSEMTFKNSDKVSHNIFANDSDAGVDFDVGLMPVGSSQKKKIDWKENKVIKIGCKIHPKMRSYIANVDSKFHKILEIPKKKKYSFSFENVPENLKEVSFWFSSKVSVEKLELKKGEKKKVDVFKKKKKIGTLELTRE